MHFTIRFLNLYFLDNLKMPSNLFLFEIKQISFPLWSRHFYTMKLKTLQTSSKFYTQLKEFTNHKTNTMVSTFNFITINCNQVVDTRTSIYLNYL